MKKFIKGGTAVKLSILAAVIFAFALWGAFAAFGDLAGSNIVKLNPLSLYVDSSGTWVESTAAWSLFDRDTASVYAPQATPARVLVTLPLSTDIGSIKVYGSASYVMTVYDGSSGSWVTVPGLESVDLTTQSAAWNTFKPSSSINTGKLMLEFNGSGGNAGGIKEIEIWGAEPGNPVLSLNSVKTAADARNILASPLPAHILKLDATPLQFDVPADGGSYPVNFTLSIDPRLIKRAYLLYDSYNADYPISAEKRINGLSWTGGFMPGSATTPEWKSQIEEINPAWLVKGANTIEFRNQGTGGDPSSYFIRGLKVIAELENGWTTLASVSGASQNANHSAQATYDGDLTTYFELTSTHTLDIKAERSVQPETVRVNLWTAATPPSGTITLQYPQGNQWKNFSSGGTIDMSTLQQGWNDIKIPAQITTDTIRLNIQVTPDRKRQGAPVGGINELELIASPIGSRPSRGLVVNYPKSGEYFGRTAYILGFVDPISNGSGTAQIFVESKSFTNTDGSFSLSLSKDETQYASQGDNDPWQTMVTAAYPDRTTLTQTVSLTKNLLNNSPSSTGNSGQVAASQRDQYSEKVIPGQAKKIQYKGVTLDIPAGAVDQETEITIIPLTEADLNRLNPGMINVTYSAAGYRFLPHGMKFKKPINISFGYSKTLFAAAQVDDEVNMYFYNESLLRWQKLNRVKVDPATSQVTSESEHFTDIINSTLVVPEHPEALTFNPNSIKDIKAADPSANIDLIEPPKADNKGAANLSYPIEVPKGRGAYTPDFKIVYSSNNADGWMGLGWDIPIPSIQVDTRWGVPFYDPKKETESYLINGQPLAPVFKWNDTSQTDRQTDRVFYKRVENDFLQIIRKGDNPTNYSWQVTDKSGVRYYYGLTPQSRLADYNIKSGNTSGNIFAWYLEKVVDTNGNVTYFSYYTDTQANYLAGLPDPKNPPKNGLTGENWVYLYLDTVSYTDNEKTKQGTKYSVTFVRDDGSRPDVVISGKSGFKTALRYRLDSVVVKYQDKTIRSYKLTYNPGDFSKSLLTTLSHKGASGAVFYSHIFDYYAMTRSSDGNYTGFGDVETWYMPSSGTLSRSDEESHSRNRYRGLAPIPHRMLSRGRITGTIHADSDTSSKFLDLNGDGLPDLVYKNSVLYNLSGAGGQSRFSDASAVNGLGVLEVEHRDTDLKGHADYAGYGSYTDDKAHTVARSSATLSDINGDGFVDLVAGSSVLYNHLIASKGFEADSSWSYSSSSDLSGIENEAKEYLHLADAVRKWVAPFNGDIRITGTVQKKAARIDQKEDGLTLSIYRGNTLIGSLFIGPDDTSVHLLGEAAGNPGSDSILIPGIQADDRIYFRVNSINNGDNDEILFDPVISYDASNGQTQQVLQSVKDVYGHPLYTYDASSDFSRADTQQSIWISPYKGTMTLSGQITKLPSVDDVTVQIWRTANMDYSVWDATLYTEYTFTAGDTETIAVNQSLDTARGERFLITVSSGRNIDPASVGVELQAVYSGVNICKPASDPTKLDCSVQPVADPNATSPDGTPLYRFKPEVYYPYTVTVPKTSSATWVAPYDGVVAVNGVVERVASSGAFTARILGVNKSLWKQEVQADIWSGDSGVSDKYPANVLLDVQKGDQLFFEVQSANPVQSAVSWSPTVTYTQYCPSGPTSCVKVTCATGVDGTISCTPSGQQFIYNPEVQYYYTDRSKEAFGGGYRQWYFGQWNGNLDWDETKIKQPANKDDDDAINVFVRMAPDANGTPSLPGQLIWTAFESNCFVSAASMEPSRVAGNINYSFSGQGIIRQSTGYNTSVGGNILVAGVQDSHGDTDTQIDLFDFNGDRYPDQITTDGVHLNDGKTGFRTDKYSLPGTFRTIHNWNAGINIGVGTVVNNIGSSGVTESQDTSSSSGDSSSILDFLFVSFSAGFAEGTSTTKADLIDINGDGLPDKVSQDNSSGHILKVSLNLGDHFGKEEEWELPEGSLSDKDAIRQQIRNQQIPLPFDSNPIGTGENRTVNVNLGVDLLGYAGASGGYSLGVTRTETAMIDVNGDGLPDQVMKYSFENFFRVKINLGDSFGPEERWDVPGWDSSYPVDKMWDLLFAIGMIDGPIAADYAGQAMYLANTMLFANDTLTSSTTEASSYGFFYNVPVVIIPPNPYGIPELYLILGRENARSDSTTKSQVAFVDIDGDGLPDHIYKSSGDHGIQVKRNLAGKVNLLRAVRRPLGGVFTLDYVRKGNKLDYSNPNQIIDMPHSQWVLSSAVLTDGRRNATGKHVYETSYSYDSGHYDRSEREFYGFHTVTETRGSGADKVTVVQTYENQNYYKKALLLTSETRQGDANGPIYTAVVNDYDLRPEAVAESQFPYLKSTTTNFYDIQKNHIAKSTMQEYTDYDTYGNILEYVDHANGTGDDVYVSIRYDQSNAAHYIVNKPKSIDVKDGGGTPYRSRSATYESGTGNLKTLSMMVEQGKNVQWSMDYDPDNGNLVKITYPQGDPSYNLKSDGYALVYAYDDQVETYVVAVTDSFGYTSSADYNYSFGLPNWTRDINGNYQVSKYDDFGRTTEIYGPYAVDQKSGTPVCSPTIAFAYNAPKLDTSETSGVNNYINQNAYALTTNRADSSKGCTSATIRTATFADGMKRIIQVRKDATINGSNGVVVTGTADFDTLGRTVKQGQPVPGKTALGVYEELAPQYPTVFSYDTLDRTIQVVGPDGATTTVMYGFGVPPQGGATMFMTTVHDPNTNFTDPRTGKGIKISYKDAHDKIVAVQEYNKGAFITTQYGYDIIDQILTVTDAQNHTTSAGYDKLGRKTSIDNPDTGLTSYSYDANGNITTKQTANLKNNPAYNKQPYIGYTYEYNRLKIVSYPTNTQDVVYTYGEPTEAGDANGNLAGRIKQVTDESGTELSYYGRLGETVKQLRRINATNNPVAKINFETDYVFDSFGRMLQLTYPDGEILTYSYDAGGLLSRAVGIKRQNQYVYVNALNYDEFGQRTYIEYGNRVKTNYTYDPLNRRLATLTTVLPSGRTIQKNTYYYDMVGNILDITNTASVPQGGEIGGPTEHHYTYDDLYQLTTANGSHVPAPGKKTTYTNTLNYDTIGNITLKVQTHLIVGTNTSQEPKETNYTFDYKYSPVHPHAVIDAGDKLYTYDDDGNMLGWTSKTTNAARVISWNEENRVKNITDSGNGTDFIYDDTGERVTKRGGGNETVYVNRFYAVKNGDLGTKHVFVNQTRVATKLEKDGGGLQTGVPGSIALINSQGIQNAITRGNGQQIGINRRLPSSSGGTTTVNPPIEKFEFFYHGDHLGSSNFITDDSGAVYQDLEYFPYGEQWVEDGGSGQMPMYRFTGQEFDPETGLYYFGARYYDPVLSRWISADPMLPDYLGGKPSKGVYAPFHLGLFTYTRNNPIIFIDPTGMAEDEPAIPKEELTWKRAGEIFVENVKNAPATAWQDFKQGAIKAWNLPKEHPDQMMFFAIGAPEMGAIAPEIGAATSEIKAATAELGAAIKGAAIETRYGPAVQSLSPQALSARTAVEEGATLYRGGVLGRSAGPEAQFWSLEHPLSPGYAARYGIPPGNVNFNFIETGTLNQGANFITRVAPGGTGIEAVVEPFAVKLNGFSMP